MKVCCAASGGGHLNELLQLNGFFKAHEHFFVSDHRQNSDELARRERLFFVDCPRRNPFKLLKNLAQSLKIFLRERPDLVLSTGADTAVPICLIAKLFGKKVVFVESFCRIESPSLSGWMMYPFADLFLVQWPGLKRYFKSAVFAGGVF